MNLKKYRYDNEYHDGLVEDPTGAWYLAADVDAGLLPALKELVKYVEDCERGYKEAYGEEYDAPVQLTDAQRVIAAVRGA